MTETKPLSSRGGTGRENVSVAAAAAPFDPWQPILTAPKSMKLLLAYRNRLDKWRTVLGCYYEERTLESSHEESGFAPAGWYEETEAYDEISLLDEPPTHWMHLPAHPGSDVAGEKAGITQAERAQRTSEHPSTGMREALEWLNGATHPLMSDEEDIRHTNTLKAALSSTGDAMRAFGASDEACYRWPDDTLEHKALRAAFITGAASTGDERREAIEECAKVATEQAALAKKAGCSSDTIQRILKVGVYIRSLLHADRGEKL